MQFFSVLCLQFALCSASNNLARLDREWKAKRATCESKDCQHFKLDEGENCINKCVSETCYNEIYASNPLEDGEFDNARHRLFVNCLRREARAAKNELIRTKAGKKETL